MTYPPTHDITILRKGEELKLHGDKALFWPRESMLVISDMHLGKSEHFRKNGIPVPGNVVQRELARLDRLLLFYRPQTVLFLGDLFHSVYNASWEAMVDFIARRPGVRFCLVEGNHDIMHMSDYLRAGIAHLGLVEQRGPFLFAHERIDELPDDLYGIYGHIHPGVRMRGRGNQVMRFPCFLFGERDALMPAYGAFTGLAMLKPKAEDDVYIIAEQKVLLFENA